MYVGTLNGNATFLFQCPTRSIAPNVWRIFSISSVNWRGHKTNMDKCPKCNKPLTIRNGKYGRFVGCTGYPDCRYTRNVMPGDMLDDDPTPKHSSTKCQSGELQCWNCPYRTGQPKVLRDRCHLLQAWNGRGMEPSVLKPNV